MDLSERCVELVAELKTGDPCEVKNVKSLTGGVASDIASFELGETRYCAKFALAKLKVAEDWHAPVHRNNAEYHWLRVAAEIAPQSAVKLFGHSQKLNGFIMEYVEGGDVSLWKTELLAGRIKQGAAASVGDLLGRIHAASSKSNFDSSNFHNQDDFYAIRIEPYLIFTAGQHDSVAGQLQFIADSLYQSSQVLIHGDISPKNILFRNGNPILLDAECATMGDACFDPAFCLNHLFLKAVHLPSCSETLLSSVIEFWQAYKQHICWESSFELEARTCRLLPALMLARIDGKSPLEYLDNNERDTVRKMALQLIDSPQQSLQALCHQLSRFLKEKSS